MPKTYSHSDKENWLKALEQGKSSRQIARDTGIDERTIKRAVQEIRSKSAAQEALRDLYREGLRNHMNGLNEALDTILKELRLPEPYLTEIAWSAIKSPQDLSQYDREDSEVKTKVSKDREDPFSNHALLAEHLRNSKAWRALGDWQRDIKKHRQACGRLQIKALRILAEKTGLQAYSEGGNTKIPVLHAENSGDLLCRSVVQYLLTGKDILKPEEFRIDTKLGSVGYRNAMLAEQLKDVSAVSTFQTNILNSLETLKASPEGQELIITFQQLEKNLPKAKNELRAISLLGVVPGQCRICRQFGP